MRVRANVWLYFVNHHHHHHPHCESLRSHQFGYWFTHLSENHWVVKSTQFTFRECDDGNVDDDNDDNAATTNHHPTTYCAHSIHSTAICHSQPRYKLFNYKNQQLIFKAMNLMIKHMINRDTRIENACLRVCVWCSVVCTKASNQKKHHYSLRKENATK